MLKKFITPIVGESHYRDVLARICDGEPADGAHRFSSALLVCEDANPHDAEAVKVVIHDECVGYLSKDGARLYRAKFGIATTKCGALITAGWNRGPDDWGDYCVRLALDLTAEDRASD